MTEGGLKKIDADWDRADAETDLAFKELDDFLRELEVKGWASTPEQRKQNNKRFIEILERCNAKALAIFERAMAGYPPTN